MNDPIFPLKQRKRIKARDENKCVLCWREYGLHIHHHWDHTGKLSDDEYRSNHPYYNTRDCDLVTLCGSCHGKIHTCEKGSPIYRFVTDYLSQFKDITAFATNPSKEEEK